MREYPARRVADEARKGRHPPAPGYTGMQTKLPDSILCPPVPYCRLRISITVRIR